MTAIGKQYTGVAHRFSNPYPSTPLLYFNRLLLFYYQTSIKEVKVLAIWLKSVAKATGKVASHNHEDVP